MAEVISLYRAKETDELPFLFRGKKSKNYWESKLEMIFSMIDDAYLPKKVREYQKEAVTRIFKAAVGGVKVGFSFPFMRKYADKKAYLVVKAKSIEEVNEVMKPSVSIISEDGSAVVGKYHIPEEELIMLVLAYKSGGLNKQAQKRFEYLCDLCFKTQDDIDEDEEDE